MAHTRVTLAFMFFLFLFLFLGENLIFFLTSIASRILTPFFSFFF